MVSCAEYRLFYRALLQKSPIKETMFCKETRAARAVPQKGACLCSGASCSYAPALLHRRDLSRTEIAFLNHDITTEQMVFSCGVYKALLRIHSNRCPRGRGCVCVCVCVCVRVCVCESVYCVCARETPEFIRQNLWAAVYSRVL